MTPRPSSARHGSALFAGVLALLCSVGSRAADESVAAASSPEAPPNFVMITIDTLRADHLGCYGYFRDTSPRLDAFAEDALLFERALAPMPTTLPSHVSLLTSSLPARHGVLSNFRYLDIPFVTGDGLQSVAQLLGRAGYATAAFTSASPLSRGTGIDVGFAHFEATRSFAEAGENVRRSAAETVDRALAWLEQAPSPFFLWVHVFDPHLPYEPPPPFDAMFSATEAKLAEHLSERGIPSVLRRHTALLTTRYDGEVRYTDAQLGRFLDGLREQGRYESSVIALAGDHGEGLYEHGDPAHEFLWRATLAVPLILRWPGGPRGVRSSRLASLVDVLPTLRAHTRLPLSAGAFDGRDLLAGEEGFVLSQEPVQASAPRQRTHALTTKDWKYWRLSDAPDRLYHLAEDPLETRNVIEEWPEDAARLRARLDELLAVARSKPGIEVSDDIDPALRARLRALGYAE